MNKEENQLCPTGMQWGGHITHPRVNASICANTRARSLKGKLSIYSGSQSSSANRPRLFVFGNMGSNYNILTVLVTLTVLKRKVEAMGCIFPFVISSCTQNIFLLVTHLLAFYVTMRILCFSFQSKSLPADKHTNTYSKARCLFLPGKNHNYQRTSLMIIHVCFKFPSVFNIICAFSRKVVAGEIPNR